MHARYMTKQMAQLMYQQKSLMRKVEEMHLLEEMVQEVRGEEMQEVRMEEMVQEVKEEMVQEVREEEMEEMEMEEMEVNLIQKEKMKTRKRMRKSRRKEIPICQRRQQEKALPQRRTGSGRDTAGMTSYRSVIKKRWEETLLRAPWRHWTAIRKTLTKARWPSIWTEASRRKDFWKK